MPFQWQNVFNKKTIKIKKTHSLQVDLSFSLLKIILSPPMNKNIKCLERVSLCTLKKASLTVESAIILPLFFIAMTTLMCFMQVITHQVKGNAMLGEKVKEAGMYAYLAPETIGNGIFSNQIIDITQWEEYKFPISLVPLPKLKYHCRARVRAWTGYNHSREEESKHVEELVYVTDYESVYHRSASCTHLDLTISTTTSSKVNSLRNEYGGKYHACKKCGNNTGTTLYITEKGDNYHKLDVCSGLKRSIRLVKKSLVKNVGPCGRCS